MKAIVPFLVLCAALLAACHGLAEELQAFDNVTLADRRNGDGDSFRVRIDERVVTIRLYFVDCPETTVGNTADARRVRTQARYFGLSGAEETLRFGEEAAAFTRRQLAKPFTLHTAFASALGRSAGGRKYGFVRTAAGESLGDLLISHGYARAHGVGRCTPEGVPRDEMAAQLADKESAAMLERCGVWAATDADRLVELRAAARKEESELMAFGNLRQETPSSIDINTAPVKLLTRLPGIGEVTAVRIVAGRPYRQASDLLHVTGIGTQTLARIRPYLALQ